MGNELEIGLWRAFPRLNQLESGTLVRKVKPRAMDVLVYMAAKPGEVVSVEELVAEVWKGVIVGDNSVYQAIRELSSVFEASGTGDYIETIPKRGYRLTAKVSRPPEPIESQVAAATERAPATSTFGARACTHWPRSSWSPASLPASSAQSLPATN